jgi:hypothetical protein
MGELVVVIVKRPHEETNDEENTDEKIEVTDYAVTLILP